MNEQKQDLYEQYVDASVALFMDRYASVLTESIKTGICETEDVTISPELDKKCRLLIKKECAKRKRRNFFQGLARGIRYAASFLILLLALSSALFLTVEAVRVPIISFYIEQSDGYWIISGNTGSTAPGEDDFYLSDPLNGLLPDEYNLIKFQESASGVLAIYADSSNHVVQFVTSTDTTSFMLDSEQAEWSKQFSFLDCEAALIKTDKLSLTWLDPESNSMYTLVVDALGEDKVLEIATEIISRFRN